MSGCLSRGTLPLSKKAVWTLSFRLPHLYVRRSLPPLQPRTQAQKWAVCPVGVQCRWEMPVQSTKTLLLMWCKACWIGGWLLQRKIKAGIKNMSTTLYHWWINEEFGRDFIIAANNAHCHCHRAGLNLANVTSGNAHVAQWPHFKASIKIHIQNMPTHRALRIGNYSLVWLWTRTLWY